MNALGVLFVRWLIHAVVVMGAVALVSPKNPRNNLTRALLVTLIVALIVTPFAFFWFLIVPGLIALVCWIVVFVTAYDIGIGQAIAVGIVQAAIGFVVDLFLIHGRLGF
ncbi:MAG TPA: hypothetical protein VG496_12505 [Myxococcales bacterium]|nr:hypothetical protein [Myxococcales bacterium]